MNKKPYIIAFCFFMLDFISKQVIIKVIDLHESIRIINNFFYLTYTRNTGAAFSILEDGRILFLIITVIALFFINKYMNNRQGGDDIHGRFSPYPYLLFRNSDISYLILRRGI